MKKREYLFIILSSLLALLPGCGGEAECPLNSVALARFEFRDSKTHVPVQITSGATVTGIATINGVLDIDTVFNQAQNYMSVPLSYTDKTTYVIHYTEIMRDTIEVKHKNIPFVSDIECPAMMFYEVEDIRYTTYALDSIKLVNPQITNEERINFNIYYRAASAD
ncbi:MAG: hypothetical protein E7097_10155 [Bacteroides sp.]|nr:hypothetical protein [Bacteroides sp.]